MCWSRCSSFLPIIWPPTCFGLACTEPEGLELLNPTMSSTTGIRATTTSSAQELPEDLTLFFKAHAGQILEIEVLPSSFPLPSGSTSPILQDGPSLGIPKKALVHAFLAARHALFRTLKLNTLNEQEAEEAMTATQVVLLFDPEHITAANYRKRRLLNLRASRGNVLPESYIDIKNELVYMESLQTSPLHRHTKSPTLWHHRRWLVTEFFDQVCQVYNLPGSNRVNSEEALERLWRAELGVVERSGDRHPKNYYAWSYARWLLDFLLRKDLSGFNAVPVKCLAERSASRIHEWCLGHPADISGWSFLVHLLQIMGHEPQLQRKIFEGVWDFVRKFSWEGEAVWWFLRTVLAMEGVMPAMVRHQYISSLVDGLQERSKNQVFSSNTDQASISPISRAILFCATFGKLESAIVDG